MKPVMLSGCRAAAWPAMPSDGHWLADPREHLREEHGVCRYICLVPFALRRLWALNLFEKNKKQTEARKRDFFFSPPLPPTQIWESGLLCIGFSFELCDTSTSRSHLGPYMLHEVENVKEKDGPRHLRTRGGSG